MLTEKPERTFWPAQTFSTKLDDLTYIFRFLKVPIFGFQRFNVPLNLISI